MSERPVSVDIRRVSSRASPVLVGRYYKGAGWYYVANFSTFQGDEVGPFPTKAAAARAFRGTYPETEEDAAIPLDARRPRGWQIADHPSAPHHLRRVRGAS